MTMMYEQEDVDKDEVDADDGGDDDDDEDHHYVDDDGDVDGGDV